MKKRIISAIVALLIFIPLLIIGKIYFKIGMMILSLIALWEIMKNKEELPLIVKCVSYLIMIITIMFNDSLLISLTFLFLSISMIFYDNKKYDVLSFTYVSTFLILIGTVFSCVIKIRNDDINVLIYLLLITILTDTFALFGGKLFGKHKLIEKVSPNKTIEGSIIGSAFGVIIPSIYYIYMVDPGANIFMIVIMTLVLSISGQLGDLVFSKIKRYFNIKDFSNIMPGHGGVLDRIDSITMVILIYQIIINII